MLIICGPTAAGKSALAIRLAQHYHTAIISADSRQCFRELNIGVARPSEAELRMVPHYFIASNSIKEDVTAVSFEQYALRKTEGLFLDHDLVVMAGGTGLYIKAFCEGLDEIPAIQPDIREKIIGMYEQQGLAWLQEEVKKKDPAFFATGEIRNPQRMMRALEVVESTGQSVLDFRKGRNVQRDFTIIKIGIDLPREELNRRIDARTEAMMEAGLLEEVQSLLPFKDRNALQTVGYAELFEYLEGKKSLEQAVSEIKTHTRQYAKRQMTWFRKDKEITWFGPGEAEEIIEWVEKNRC